MDVARQAGTLVEPCPLDRPLGEAGPFDRHRHLVGHSGQQVELAARQPPPVAHGEIHHAERPIAGIQRHARVAAQPAGLRRLACLDRRGQPAALDDIDVAGRELAALEEVETPAGPAGHSHRFLQVGRQALGGGAVEAMGGGVEQPHPAGLDAQQVRHAPEGFAGGALLGGGAIERLGHFLQHAQGSRLCEPACVARAVPGLQPARGAAPHLTHVTLQPA